jgi:GT2 family glycosyltransferase
MQKLLEAPVPTDRKALIVAGSHRSGTSALARVLSLCGAALPQSLVPARPDNETGFWEPADVVELHERLLAELSSSWDDPTAFPEQWFSTSVAESYRAKLAAVLRDNFGDAPLFLVKDPRICRLIPLWLPVLERMGAAPSVVIPVRNPLAVAASLRARNGMGMAKGMLIWLRYTLSAEKASRDLPRVIVSYEDLMQDWRGVVDRIMRGCGIALCPSAQSQVQIDQFLRQELRHHQYRLQDLEQYAQSSDWVISAYKSLTSPGAESPAALAVYDRVRAELDQADLVYAPVLAEATLSKLDYMAEVERHKLALSAQVERARLGESEAAQRAREVEAVRAEAAATVNALNDRLSQVTLQAEDTAAQLAAHVQEVVRLRHELQIQAESKAAELTERAREISQLRLALQARAGDEEKVRLVQAESDVIRRQLDALESESNRLRQERLVEAQSFRQQLDDWAAMVKGRDLIVREMADAATRRENIIRELRQECLVATEESQRANAAGQQKDRVIAEMQGRLDTGEQIRAELEGWSRRNAAERDALANLADRMAGLLAQLEECPARLDATLNTRLRPFVPSNDAANLKSQLVVLRGEIERFYNSRSWKLTEPLRSVRRWLRGEGLSEAHRRIAVMSRDPTLFDAEFYLNTYPDVRSSGLDPLQHYLASGVHENRLTRAPESDGPVTVDLPPRPEAALDMAAPAESSVHSRLISPPAGLAGAVDYPPQDAGISGLVSVKGWVLQTTEPCTMVGVEVSIGDAIAMAMPVERPDVQAAFPKVKASRQAGFNAYLDVMNLDPGEYLLTVSAVLEDRSRLPCLGFPVRVIEFVGTVDETQSAGEHSHVSLIGGLTRVAGKAWRALRDGRIPPVSRWLFLVNAELARTISPAVVPLPAVSAVPTSLYGRWRKANALSPRLLQLMAADASVLAESGPTISVLVPLYNTPRRYLTELVDSLAAQLYPNWELCLADDASPEPSVLKLARKFAARDSRIRVIALESNGGISRATNAALEVASGEFCALLDHDDLLSPDALLHVAEALQSHPATDWVYTDEDKIDDDGNHFDVQLKGGWSPEMALTHNYTHHLTVIRSEVLRQVGGLRSDFDGAQDLDLFLRVAEVVDSANIRHLPFVCYHWRAHQGSTASRGDQKSYIFKSARRAIEEALERRGVRAEPRLPAIAVTNNWCLYQLSWPQDVLARNPVTIVIPTRDRGDLLRKCVISLQNTLPAGHVRLIIVDDRSTDSETLDYMQELVDQAVFSCKIVRNQDGGSAFNYSRLVNLALDWVETDLILHLNNDVVASKKGWLEDMVGWISLPGVGVVGARLLNRDGTVQHAGVTLRGPEQLPLALCDGLAVDASAHIAELHAARNVAAVTGACLLTVRSLYAELGGFDEDRFAVEFNDIDYCLRVIDAGHRVVCTPQASLTHLGSASRGGIPYNPQEHINYLDRYETRPDPFLSRFLKINGGRLQLSLDQFAHVERVGKLKVLFVSHDLKLGGAPIVLAEYARHFRDTAGFDVTMVAPEGGPLHDVLIGEGMAVEIVGKQMLTHQVSTTMLEDSLKALGDRLGLADYDLIVCNTVTTYWAVEMARLFGRPVVWHIHESINPTEYGRSLPHVHIPLLPRAFAHAGAVVFQSGETRKLYEHMNMGDRFHTIPGGLPVERIEDFRARNPKEKLRRKYHIPQDKTVVTLIGTFCERKGQHLLVGAIDELNRRWPEGMRDVVVLMVGAREENEAYIGFVKDKIAAVGATNIQIHDETNEIYDYFGLSDVFVCASYNESFPMVVLLAMAFELRVVSTNVFGISEIISDGNEGALCPPGQAHELANMLRLSLEHAEAYKRLAGCARAKVRRLFDNRMRLPQHVRLAQAISLTGDTRP